MFSLPAISTEIATAPNESKVTAAMSMICVIPNVNSIASIGTPRYAGITNRHVNHEALITITTA